MLAWLWVAYLLAYGVFIYGVLCKNMNVILGATEHSAWFSVKQRSFPREMPKWQCLNNLLIKDLSN